jgi:hypothetical protein
MLYNAYATYRSAAVYAPLAILNTTVKYKVCTVHSLDAIMFSRATNRTEGEYESDVSETLQHDRLTNIAWPEKLPADRLLC